ncbi:MAG: hypothetical protein PVSMB1_02400 [Gemmatimonadaceae bacterium]
MADPSGDNGLCEPAGEARERHQKRDSDGEEERGEEQASARNAPDDQVGLSRRVARAPLTYVYHLAPDAACTEGSAIQSVFFGALLRASIASVDR